MCTFADNQRSQLELAGLLDGQIILAKMNAVGTCSNRHINPVIYYAKYAGVLTYPYKFDSNSKKFVVLDGLRTQLDAIGTAGCALASQRNNLRRQVVSNYHVQPDALEFLKSITEKDNIFLECISSVSQVFDRLGYGPVLRLGHLGKHPQCLG